MNYEQEIMKLKKERDILILAHYYQNLNIQLVADHVGDSLELAKKAAQSPNNTILFCGVHFMAESVKILSPEKKVLIPKLDAGCPMADKVNGSMVRELRKKHPDAAVVCYINSTAETKAEVDICCTSSNAVEIIKKIHEKKIIFIPDKNLGRYTAAFHPDKEFIYIENGCCPVHDKISLDSVKKAKKQYPNAKLAVHPECKPEVLKEANFIGSTLKIIDYVNTSSHDEFIIGTETGIVNRLRYFNPDKTYHELDIDFICEDMKKTSIDDVYNTIINGEHEINVPVDIVEKARIPLEKMMM